MVNVRSIRPKMVVMCSDGVCVASVERIIGDRWLALTPDEHGTVHFIPSSWVHAVDGAVYVDRPHAQVRRQWSLTPSADGVRTLPPGSKIVPIIEPPRPRRAHA